MGRVKSGEAMTQAIRLEGKAKSAPPLKGGSGPDMETFVNNVWLPAMRADNSSWKIDEGIWKRHIRPFWGPHKLSETRATAISEWLGIFENGKYAVSTRNRILCTLKSIFKAAGQNGYLDASPLAGIKCLKTSKRDSVNLTEADLREIITALKEDRNQEAAAILLMIFTGAAKRIILNAVMRTCAWIKNLSTRVALTGKILSFSFRMSPCPSSLE